MKAAVHNLSGGCRKTATAISIASSLAMKGFKTLLIDSNPQCDATRVLGQQENAREDTLYPTIEEGVGLFIDNTDIENLDIVHSHEDLRNIDDTKCADKLKEAVDEIANDYEYIIFDTFNDVDCITDAILSICDLVIIPLAADIKDIHAADSTIKYINLIKKFHNPNLRMSFLRTSVDTRFKITAMLQDELLNHDAVFENVYHTVIPSSTKLPQAFAEQKVLLEVDPENPVCLAYDSLVREAFLKS